jgi:hypothetical protein
MEKLVKWTVLAGETEVLGENLPRRHFVYHKFQLPDTVWTRAAAVGSKLLTAWAMARPSPALTQSLYQLRYRNKEGDEKNTQRWKSECRNKDRRKKTETMNERKWEAKHRRPLCTWKWIFCIPLRAFTCVFVLLPWWFVLMGNANSPMRFTIRRDIFADCNANHSIWYRASSLCNNLDPHRW